MTQAPILKKFEAMPWTPLSARCDSTAWIDLVLDSSQTCAVDRSASCTVLLGETQLRSSKGCLPLSRASISCKKHEVNYVIG